MSVTLVDTHCHLDLPAFDADREAVLERARQAGVVAFVLIGYSPASWDRALALAERTPGLVVALGVHPNEADAFDSAVEHRLRQLLRHPLVRAVGEIGLDYHWKTVDPAIQQRVFRRQLELAQEYDLPIVLHQREAHDDLLTILNAYQRSFRGVMHCFTGDRELACRFLELGLHLGIGGVVTYRNAEPLRHAVQDMPLELMLLETDAPYLAPSPHRGKRNEPAFLPFVLATIAHLRSVSEAEIAVQTTRNALQLFRLSAIGAGGSIGSGSIETSVGEPDE
ncbi:TatD family hydrolase [Thermomicrobium sp. 4228-Ro]|uniref:TatD family hydrolase n=1 Tax=Thermomicrobium sp. 4228-Ro TaxID=2993937 RepID=UPI002248CE19|nr:TatD family hydrolase [Thermomicrobium sp. 4228-Ro]MCX2726163.1 TatD family hydrolase [Thermomicrobium sp. 4228-Ro]